MPRKKTTGVPADNIWGKIITGDASEYLPLFEFAKKLKLKEEYLIGLAKSGRLKAFKIDDYWLSTSTWVNEWLDEVKNHLRREIGDAMVAETADIMPSSRGKITVLKKTTAKIQPSFYKEIGKIRRELSAEIAKGDKPDNKTNWVNDAGSNNSFSALLNIPIKLAIMPKQTSHNHYALILALFLVMIASLFIYTVVLAGF